MGAPDATEASREQMEACAAYGQTGPEHELLKRFEGRWTSVVRLWFEPAGDPQESTGVMVNEMILGDKYLQHTYEDDTGMFSGRGFWGYNATDGRWEGFWIDSMSTFFQIEHGTYDAMNQTWSNSSTMTDPVSKSVVNRRSVITVTSPDTHRVEMFMTPTAGEGAGVECRAMSIEYTRA